MSKTTTKAVGTKPVASDSPGIGNDRSAGGNHPRYWHIRVPRAHPAWWILGTIVLLWVVVMGRLVWLRHDRMESLSLDMGVYDQAVWLLSRFGQQLITVRGVPVFGHHVSPAMYLLAPFYWLGAGAHFLNLLQVVSLALGAIPVFLIARDRLSAPWMALILASAYLLHPSLQFMAWELFHPDAMAITPLLFAYWFSRRGQWRWFIVSLVLAVAWREDVALAAAALGLLVAIRGQRLIGLRTAVSALAWFIFTTRVVPYFSGTEAYYSQVLGALGDPSVVVGRLSAATAKSYYWRMTAPFGLVSLAGAGPLLVGLPQTLLNVLSVTSSATNAGSHYGALPLAALTIASIEGSYFLVKRAAIARWLVAGIVLSSALATSVAWGPSPISMDYRNGWWPAGPDARRTVKQAAMASIPDGASVSASYLFVSQLSHRQGIYEFPNPFRPKNWGVGGENYPPPTAADWLVVDRQLLAEEDQTLLAQLLADDYTVQSDRDDVVVARRR